MQEKYEDLVVEMAEALGKDPEKFRVREALPHIESIYARQFEGYPMLMTFS